MLTVLIVDDSPLDRRIAGGYVEAHGYRALYAEDGREALRKIEQHGPDIVVTDLQMPGINGLELVQELKRSHSAIPVILMTAHGSEEIAVEALQSGACSYVPKKDLKEDIKETLQLARDVARSRHDRELVYNILTASESCFVLGYQPNGPRALVGHLQQTMEQMALCDQSDLNRVGTALREALANAIEHGNLELDSALRARGDGSYQSLARERTEQIPYKHRRVHVTAHLTNSAARFVVRDEGPGFDPSTLPDPTDPENILRVSGRGLLLIRTLMDDAVFNESGNQITMIKAWQQGSTG